MRNEVAEAAAAAEAAPEVAEPAELAEAAVAAAVAVAFRGGLAASFASYRRRCGAADALKRLAVDWTGRPVPLYVARGLEHASRIRPACASKMLESGKPDFAWSIPFARGFAKMMDAGSARQ